MPRYQSRLEAVLKQRKYREEEAAREFAEINNRLATEQDQLQKLSKELEEILDGMTEKQKKGMSPDDLNLYYRFIKRQREKIEERRTAVERLANQCEEKRISLEQAVQGKKMVEKIEETRKASYHKETEKKEGQILDDMAGRRKQEMR